MDDRLIVVAALVMAGLSGCTAAADSSDTFTADAALGEAEDAVPDGELIAIFGTEGAQPEREGESLAAHDDGVDDGRLGDGKLSSWVVTFAAASGLKEVRVFADGREPETKTLPLPSFVRDQEGRSDGSSRRIDSDDAAAIARDVEEFAQHVGDYPEAGYTYSYYPYGRQYPVRDWSTGLFRDYNDMEVIGWSIWGNTWTVTHYDPLAWVGDSAPTTAEAGIDAATGKVLAMTVSVPREVVDIISDVLEFADPVPPTGIEPYVHEWPFDIQPGSSSLGGILTVYHSGLFGGLAGNLDAPIFRIVAPDGTVVAESDGQFGFTEIVVDNPASGTWTLEVTHGLPVPATLTVAGFLFVAQPVTP